METAMATVLELFGGPRFTAGGGQWLMLQQQQRYYRRQKSATCHAPIFKLQLRWRPANLDWLLPGCPLQLAALSIYDSSAAAGALRAHKDHLPGMHSTTVRRLSSSIQAGARVSSGKDS